MPETILKLLEDPNRDNDETNARIWCFENNREYKGTDKYGQFSYNLFYPLSMRDPRKKLNKNEKYTTSLDAAMSIGAEELEGHRMDISTENCAVGIYLKKPFFYWIRSEKLSTLFCAIAYVRIKALAYKRGL